ncbi:MAG: hypothetical protein FWG84_10455 [Bacteroidales bacterium]|nr:hypothetical protein [Bacteroidales bacterium]
MKKLIIALICLSAVSIHAQDVIDPETLEKQNYIAINSVVATIGGGVLPFNGNDLMKSDIWNKPLGMGFQLSVDFRKQFAKEKVINDNVVDHPSMCAVGAGLGFSFYNKSANFDNFAENLPGLTDVDGYTYEARLSYSNINEKMSALYLEIPIYLEIGRPSLTKVSGFGKIGIKPALLLSGSFKGEGTYTWEGYYPEWYALLYDIDHLVFENDAGAYKNPEYKYNPFVLWANVSAGITIPLSSVDKDILRTTLLRIGLKYDFTVMKISKSTSDLMLPGAEYQTNQSNMLGGKGSSLHYAGLDVALIFCLRYTQVR